MAYNSFVFQRETFFKMINIFHPNVKRDAIFHISDPPRRQRYQSYAHTQLCLMQIYQTENFTIKLYRCVLYVIYTPLLKSATYIYNIFPFYYYY